MWLNVAVLGLSLAGFVSLALASQRPGELLLGRLATAREVRRLRGVGWPLLAGALALCFWGWGWTVGAVAWLGWLCMAGAALVFALPRWTDRRRGAKPMPPSPLQLPARSRPARAMLLALLVCLPLGFAWRLAVAPPKPVLRADAVSGKAGPWPFRLAEVDHLPPETVRGIPLKSFQVRFCDTCNVEIRSAYIKVNRPRSLRGAGMVLGSSRSGEREALIQLPGTATAQSELWLTVEGIDGSVHYSAVPLGLVAPASVEWLARQR